ncbi:MAG: endonuclease/exonuclease/phosphatase family protein [Planctomycetes bacterium]|nr:endonuclease/exonuclease/phosphatase family protein [Planctomycetota bacterium]
MRSLARALTWSGCLGCLLGGILSCQLVPRDRTLVTPPPASIDSGAAPIATLRVGTFNIHDLYLASSDRPERMRAIADLLIDTQIQVAGIQEAFVASDREVLFARLGDQLPYHAYFDYGPVGSGLLIVSAFPIVATSMQPFEARGKWYKPWHGDWWAGKGVASATLACPGLDVVLMDVHAHAQHDFEDDDEYLDVRTRQMVEIASRVEEAARGDALAFLVGDLNCGPGDSEYEHLSTAPLVHLLGAVIDHIFVVPNRRVEVELRDAHEPLPIRVHRDGVLELSDHDLMWCDVALTLR